MPESQSCVIPVVDYEPPLPAGPRSSQDMFAHGSMPGRASDRPRSTNHPATALDHQAEAQRRSAAAFADASLRRLLEVLDRRRPLTQLRPLLAASLLDSLLQGPGRRDHPSAAHLRRVRVQLVGASGAAAEVAASYARGPRMHAIACRIEQIPTTTGSRWQVVALHLG